MPLNPSGVTGEGHRVSLGFRVQGMEANPGEGIPIG